MHKQANLLRFIGAVHLYKIQEPKNNRLKQDHSIKSGVFDKQQAKLARNMPSNNTASTPEHHQKLSAKNEDEKDAKEIKRPHR